MFGKIQSIFKIPELRRRILFTLALLVVFRVGAYVPVPGIDSQSLAEALQRTKGTLLGLYDMFAGGAFSRATIFALGIMSYISASIIMPIPSGSNVAILFATIDNSFTKRFVL